MESFVRALFNHCVNTVVFYKLLWFWPFGNGVWSLEPCFWSSAIFDVSEQSYFWGSSSRVNLPWEKSEVLNSGFENRAAIHSSVYDIFCEDSHFSECAFSQIQQKDTFITFNYSFILHRCLFPNDSQPLSL